MNEEEKILKDLKNWIRDLHELIKKRPLVWGGDLVGLENRLEVLDTVDFIVNFSTSSCSGAEKEGFLWRDFLDIKFPDEPIINSRGAVAIYLQENYPDNSLAEFVKLRAEFEEWRSKGLNDTGIKGDRHL